MGRCDWLLPTFNVLLTPDYVDLPNDNYQCLRVEHHEGQHVSRLLNGRFIAWEPDRDCDDCGEGCECFIYRPVLIPSQE